MDRQVWKYQVDMMAATEPAGWLVAMPVGSLVRHVGAQKIETSTSRSEALMLWAEGEVSAEREARTFHVVGTGHGLVDPSWYHVGTAQVGDFVWHLYEGVA